MRVFGGARMKPTRRDQIDRHRHPHANDLKHCPQCEAKTCKAMQITTSLSGEVRYWAYRCQNSTCNYGYIFEEPID